MSIELTTREIGKEKIIYDGFSEQEISCDVSLPDYCPDIMRILSCTVTPNITGRKLVGDRASAEGNAKITVVYSDEKNKVFCYSSDYPFSKFAELSAPCDSAALCCTAKTEFVNCRAVSKRRIDIHGALSVHFKISGTSREKIISSADGDGIQLKRRGLDISSLTAEAAKYFQLSQTEEIGEAMPGIGRILDCSAAPVVSETKIIKGKLLIKGELAVRVIYSSDSGENDAAVLSCSIPFNEIAEAADFRDGCQVKLDVKVIALTAEPEENTDGAYRQMNINAEVCAFAEAYEDACVSVITDAYSTKTDIESEYGTAEFSKIEQSFSDTFSCRQSLDLSSLKPQKIYCFSAAVPQVKCGFADGKMTVKGKLPLNLIVIDSDGVPVFCEREAEFEYSRSADTEGKALICVPHTGLTGCSCTLTGNGTAEFKAEFNISGAVFSEIKEKMLCSLSAAENSQPKKHKSSLTVYFCSGNESLWDIARRYNTTVEEIMEENELSADYLQNKTMLMIPIK